MIKKIAHWAALALAVFLVYGKIQRMGHYTYPTSDESLASVTAAITNLEENSGGSGVIVQSRSDESFILTNAHVCGVVKHGGYVHTPGEKSLVVSYQVSQHHDLCLIAVHKNLHVNTKVADSAPEDFSEAAVTGHPSLYPATITRGHFSRLEFIRVMTGFRECTKEDFEGPDAGMCVFFGGIPVVKLYEAQAISALISPGSSGSAVFNSSGRISGLAFAGSGPLNFGKVVPQAYIHYFINDELRYLPNQYPQVEGPDMEAKATAKLSTVCKAGSNDPNYVMVKSYCEYVDADLVFTE